MTVLSQSYNLYSYVQRADDIVVVIPAEAGEKHFDFEERVKLVNPRITAECGKYAIHHYELPFEISEYTSISEINRLCEMVMELEG